MQKFLMVLVFVSSLVSAVDSSWVQPLTSRTAMRSYLVQNSVVAYVDTYGDGALRHDGDSISATGSNALELCEKISIQTLSLRVLKDRLDDVNQVIQMLDQSYNTTFIGWKSVTLVDINGSLQVADPEIKLTMPDQVSVEVPANVVWVMVRTRDSKGDLVGGVMCEINERNGTFYMSVPTNSLGDSFESGYYGELLVEYQTDDGYELNVYDLVTGLPLPSTDTVTSVTPTLEGVKKLVPDSDIAEILPSTNGVGVNTLFVLDVTTKRNVTVRAKTSEGEVAVGVYIKALKGEMTSPNTYYFTLPTSDLVLPAGQYHIWFAWSNFHEWGERGPGWDYYDNGRG